METTNYGLIGGFKGFGGALKEQALMDMKRKQFEQEALLNQANIAKAQREAMYPDVDKLGEQAFFKAAQGLALSPQEEAAAKFVNAKSGGIAFDPITGNMYQKPNIASNLGINFGGNPQQPTGPRASAPNTNPQIAVDDYMPLPPDMGQALPFDYDPNSEWDVKFKKTYDAAAGNPKLQQQLVADYSKDKFNMNESQSKNATYADRLALAEPILTDPNKIEAYSSFGEKALDFINPFGAQLNSADYQSYKQAQLDAASARLRQESGAVIGESEYKYDKEQLYPQVGDSPEVIEQKRQNREAIKRGLSRGAGPSYVPPKIVAPTTGKKNGSLSAIPISAAQELRANPGTAAQFDEIFGAGASNRVLGR